jgi:hypothetical protein
MPDLFVSPVSDHGRHLSNQLQPARLGDVALTPARGTVGAGAACVFRVSVTLLQAGLFQVRAPRYSYWFTPDTWKSFAVIDSCIPHMQNKRPMRSKQRYDIVVFASSRNVSK